MLSLWHVRIIDHRCFHNKGRILEQLTTEFQSAWRDLQNKLLDMEVVGLLYAVFHSRPSYDSCTPKISGTAWACSYPDEILSEINIGHFLENDFSTRYICDEGKPLVWCDNSLIEQMTPAERARWENESTGYFASGVSVPIFDHSRRVCGGFGLASRETAKDFWARWERDQEAITALLADFDRAHRGAMAVTFFKLSTRELDTLAYAAAGMTSKEAAKLIDLSPKTVESYLNAARVKTHSRNTTEAVAKAVFFHII